MVGRKLVIFSPSGSKAVIPGSVVCYIQNRVQKLSDWLLLITSFFTYCTWGATINKSWPKRKKVEPSPSTNTGIPTKSPKKSQSTLWFTVILTAKQELVRKLQLTHSWPRAAVAKPVEEHGPLWSCRDARAKQQWQLPGCTQSLPTSVPTPILFLLSLRNLISLVNNEWKGPSVIQIFSSD